jgi:hypothetical protein
MWIPVLSVFHNGVHLENSCVARICCLAASRQQCRDNRERCTTLSSCAWGVTHAVVLLLQGLLAWHTQWAAIRLGDEVHLLWAEQLTLYTKVQDADTQSALIKKFGLSGAPTPTSLSVVLRVELQPTT